MYRLATEHYEEIFWVLAPIKIWGPKTKTSLLENRFRGGAIICSQLQLEKQMMILEGG